MKTLRRILFGFAGTVLLAAVSLTGNEYFNRWQAHGELDALFADLDQNDPRWRLHDVEVDRAALADDKNSARLVVAAHGLIRKEAGQELLPWDGLQNVPPPRLPNPDQARKLIETIGRVPAAVCKARELEDFPAGRYAIEYSPDFISTLMPEQQKARGIAGLLEMDVCRAILNGDGDRAWHSNRALLNAGRSLGDEPLLISMLIRMAVASMAVGNLERVLAHAELGPECLEERGQAFSEELAVPYFGIGIRGERAGVDWLCKNLEAGKIKLGNLGGAKHEHELNWWDEASQFFAHAHFLQSHAVILRYQTAMVKAARLPPTERYAELHNIQESISENVKPDDRRLVLARLLLPAIGKIAQAEQRVHSHLACAVAAMAVERFRLEKGRWPASLEEAMVEVPLDRHDGKPLRFRRTDDGVVVYSVGIYYGPNKGLYDGTGLDDLDKFDPGASRVEFRLWNPDRRALPPVVKKK